MAYDLPKYGVEFTSTNKAMEDGPAVRREGHTKLVHGGSLMCTLNRVEFGDLSGFLEIVSSPVPAL